MKLLTVSVLSPEYEPMEINSVDNTKLRLAVQHIIDKDYNTKFEIHKEFRKAIPEGRYSLAVADGSTCYVYDTQLLDRDNN